MTVRNAASMGTYGSTWQAAGYSGGGNVAELVGSLKGRSVIVCGNAAGVFEELEAARRLLPDPIIFAANDVGMYLPKLDHWATLHSDNFGAWKQVRWLHPASYEVTKYHCPDKRPYADYAWEGLTPLFCLSGYFAMQLAWIMGAERIVLAGCPGSRLPRFFEATPRGRSDQERDEFGYGSGQAGSDAGVREQLEKEMERLPEFKSAVRSMSGWTKEFFGPLEG